MLIKKPTVKYLFVTGSHSLYVFRVFGHFHRDVITAYRIQFILNAVFIESWKIVFS